MSDDAMDKAMDKAVARVNQLEARARRRCERLRALRVEKQPAYMADWLDHQRVLMGNMTREKLTEHALYWCAKKTLWAQRQDVAHTVRRLCGYREAASRARKDAITYKAAQRYDFATLKATNARLVALLGEAQKSVYGEQINGMSFGRDDIIQRTTDLIARIDAELGDA